MVGQPHRNFMKMASWSSVSEHLVNPIGMSDQLKWNNHSNFNIYSNYEFKSTYWQLGGHFILSKATIYLKRANMNVFCSI